MKKVIFSLLALFVLFFTGFSYAAITIAPSPYDFGNVGVGQTSSRTFRITNTGLSNVTLTGVSTSGDTVSFTLTSTSCSGILRPAASCSAVVAFGPHSEGAKSAYVTVEFTGGHTTVALSGTGVVCSYSIHPASRSVSVCAAESLSVAVYAPTGCSWTAASNDSWMAIVSGSPGNGDGTVYYSASPNPGPGSRSGTLTIAGQTHTATQEGPVYSISPSSASYSSGSQTGTVSVTAPGCETFGWTASSNDSWITISSVVASVGKNGYYGNGTVNYSVSANLGTSSRTGTMTIAGLTFIVTQVPLTSCVPTLLSPASGAVLDNGCTSGSDQMIWDFDWSDCPGATQYHLYVIGPNTTVPFIDTYDFNWSSWHYESNSYIVDANRLGWRWKVQAMVGGVWGPWSSERSFDVEPLNTDCTTCTYTLSVGTWPLLLVGLPGTVAINPQKSAYCAGDQVTLTATPNSGWAFSSWSGDANGSGNPITITMNSSKSVTANFTTVASCTYSISPTSRSHGSGAETGSVNVTAGSGCSWTAGSYTSWITITSGSSGSGSGTVSYSVSANSTTSSRTGTMLIAGNTFTVTQAPVHIEGFTIVPVPYVSPDWTLHGFHFTGLDEGWAVGYDPANWRGVLLHYGNGSWTPVTLPSVGSDWSLGGVHFTSSNEGWAVGQTIAGSSNNYAGDPAGATTASGLLLHYLNNSWASVAPPSVSSDWSIEGVHFASLGEGWAVGSDVTNNKGVLLHYSNGHWTSVSPPLVSSEWELYGVYLLSSNEGWAVGRDLSNSRGVLLHYLNGSWTVVTPPSVSSGWYLQGIHFTSSKEGWAVGRDLANKSGVLIHYVNGTWTSVAAPSVSSDWDLQSVHFVSSSQGWAAGQDRANNRGAFLHYSNGSWKSVTSPNVSSSWGATGVKCRCSETWAVGGDSANKRGLSLQYRESTGTEKPNLIPYRPKGWSDKIVVSTVKEANVDSSPLLNTDSLYVGFAVLNDINNSIGSGFQVILYVDGVKKDSWEWTPLDGCNYGYVKDYPIGSLDPGTHSIKVVVDSTGVIDEANEGDNEYEKVITVNRLDKANLVFSTPAGWGWSDRVIVSKMRKAVDDSGALTAKDRLYVSWCVQNNGGVKTPGKATVTLYVDGNWKKSWKNNRSINPSSPWVKTDQVGIGKLGVGKHEISLVVDWEGIVLEGNEGDHEVVKVINIQAENGEVGAPSTLVGEWNLAAGREYSYQASGAVCYLGGEAEYQFDWGDGTSTGWLPAGQAEHSWDEGNYPVKVRARCKEHATIESKWLWRFVTVFGESCPGGDGDD